MNANKKNEVMNDLNSIGLTQEYLNILTKTNYGQRIFKEMVDSLKNNYFFTRIQWFNLYNKFFPKSTTIESVLSVKIDQTRIASSCQPNLLIIGGNITTKMLMLENNLGLPLKIKFEEGKNYNLNKNPERKGTYAAWTPGQDCSKEKSVINLKQIIEDPALKQIVLNGNIRFCSLKELLLRNMFTTFIYGKPIDSGKVITTTRLNQHNQPEKLVGIDFENNLYLVINLDFKNINKKQAEEIFFCTID